MFKSKMITNHKYVKRFETAIANYLDVKYAVCVSSGTSGLMLAAKVLGLKGDIILPSFTFSATAHALKWCGLNLIFVDIDPQTFNIDVNKIEKAITPKTSGIVAVHVFGNPCDNSKLEFLAKKHNLKLLFDSAHAFGSKMKDKMIGSFGDIEVFSLTPTKILTAGEGGIITTNDYKIYQQLILDREYGKTPDYDCKTIGLSARMSEFNAILGFHNLKNIDYNIKRRLELLKIYKSELGDIEGISFQKLQESAECSLKDFPIIINKNQFGIDRNQLAEALSKENIGHRKYFYPPIHRETVYKNSLDSEENLKFTNLISDNIINLPFFIHYYI